MKESDLLDTLILDPLIGSCFKRERDELTGTEKTALENLIKGVFVCLENSKELLDEARLLHKNDKCSRGMALLILSMEELGKAAQLFEESLEYGEKSGKATLEDRRGFFERHDPKLIKAIEILFRTHLRPDFPKTTLTKLLNKQKQAYLYVSNPKGNLFTPPEKPTKRELYQQIRGYENIFYHTSSSFKQLALVHSIGIGRPLKGKFTSTDVLRGVEATIKLMFNKKDTKPELKEALKQLRKIRQGSHLIQALNRIPQILPRQMSINHCSLYLAVPKKLLDRIDGLPALGQIACEGVAQSVDVDILNAGFSGCLI